MVAPWVDFVAAPWGRVRGSSLGHARGSSSGSVHGSSSGSAHGSSSGSACGSSSSGDGSSSSSAGHRGGSRHGRGGVHIYGYPDAAPVLNGASRCPHCFCGPCIVASPPAFLVGTAPAESRNAYKRFPLYRKFWRVFDDLGVWRHVEYLERKAL